MRCEHALLHLLRLGTHTVTFKCARLLRDQIEDVPILTDKQTLGFHSHQSSWGVFPHN